MSGSVETKLRWCGKLCMRLIAKDVLNFIAIDLQLYKIFNITSHLREAFFTYTQSVVLTIWQSDDVYGKDRSRPVSFWLAYILLFNFVTKQSTLK